VVHAALLVETAIVLTSADSVPDVWQNAVVAAGLALTQVAISFPFLFSRN